MYDVVNNGKKYQDDYIRIKKTIQEIVGRSKKKTPAQTKSKTKKKEPQDKSECLMKQFLELQEFQKKLADVTLGSANKNKMTTRPKEAIYEESDGDKETISSSSDSRTAVDRSNAKKQAKREEYNTDELSSDDTERVGGEDDRTEEMGSDESEPEIASYKSSTESKESSGLGTDGKTRNDFQSVQSIKKKSVLSPSELAIIKDLCRDLIKKEEKPMESTEVKPEKETKKEKEDTVKTEHENFENQKHIESAENKKYYVKTENIDFHNCNIVTGVTENCENDAKTQDTQNTVNLESFIHESVLNEEVQGSAMGQNMNEITNHDEKPNEELMDALVIKGELMMISEHKEETITADEKIEKVHLEIVTKETIEEVDEWKKTKKLSEEKLVIQKTVKVTEEEKEKTETETEKEEQAKEQALCNMSDDDLIQQTMREMEQIDQEFMNEEAHQVEEHMVCHYSCCGDGDKKRLLEERIDRLQEDILSLRAQLEEAKRQNEEEAREVEYLSAMMYNRGYPQLRNGSDWDEWELKEMVRERMEQKRLKAMQEYQARLGAVEALCSAEMGKLEESLQTLLPLNATVSTWDASPEPVDLSSRSWQAQDYVFEVVTSMNVSSSGENGVSRTISTNGEQPSLLEWKAEGQ